MVFLFTSSQLAAFLCTVISLLENSALRGKKRRISSFKSAILTHTARRWQEKSFTVDWSEIKGSEEYPNVNLRFRFFMLLPFSLPVLLCVMLTHGGVFHTSMMMMTMSMTMVSHAELIFIKFLISFEKV